MKAQVITESQPSTLIGEFPPRRSFLQKFQRWEWMLVALILLDILINVRLSPFFLHARNLFRDRLRIESPATLNFEQNIISIISYANPPRKPANPRVHNPINAPRAPASPASPAANTRSH